MTGPRYVDVLCEQVRALASVMEERGLSRLEVDDGAGKLVLARPVDRFAAFPAPIVVGQPPPPPPPPPLEGDDGDGDGGEAPPVDPADDPDEDLLYASAGAGGLH